MLRRDGPNRQPRGSSVKKKADEDLTEQPSLDEGVRLKIQAGASALRGTGIKIAEAASFIRRTVDLEKLEEAASAIGRTGTPEKIAEAGRAWRRRYARLNPPPQLVPRRDMQPAPNNPKPVGDHNDERKSKPRIIRQGAQSTRVDVVLKRLFPPDGIPPCREELANADLWDQFSREYARVEGAQHPPSLHDIPSKDTLFHKVGRK